MSTEQNKAIVRGYMSKVLSEGNLAAFDDYMAPDVVFNGGTGLKQQLAAMDSHFRSIFGDYHLTIEDQVAEGDKVATRVTFHGVHRGEYKGIPPTGKTVTWAGVAIDRIAGGRVVEMWHVSDESALSKQLGAKVA